MLALTHSPAQAGFVGALETLTFVAFSLPAGALVDRWDRKRTMILCDVGRTLAMASVPLAAAFGDLTVAQLYLVALVEGTFSVFFYIAEVACLPGVVTSEQLPAAMAQNQATIGVTALVGPALGGLLYAVRRTLPVLADAVSYAVSVATLALIRVPFQAERRPPQRSLRAEIREGLGWLWRAPTIRDIALLSGAINFSGAGFSLIFIVLAQGQGAAPQFIGFVFGVGGVGGVVGTLLAGRLASRLTFGQTIVGSVWSWAAIWLLLALAPNTVALAAVVCAFYLASPAYNVRVISYRLAMTPDVLQGRVNSAARMIANGLAPLGLALTGILLQAIGPTPTVLLIAGWQALAALAATLDPHIQQAPAIAKAQLHAVAQEEETHSMSS